MGVITNAIIKVFDVGSYEGDGIDPQKIVLPFKPYYIRTFIEQIGVGTIGISSKLELFGEWKGLDELNLVMGDDITKIVDDGFLAKTFMNMVGFKYTYYATRFIP